MKSAPGPRTSSALPTWKLQRGSPGMTLVELLIAFVILVLAMGGLLRGMVATTELSAQSQELAIAVEGARAIMEELHAEDITTTFQRYNADPADDPPGEAPGSAFAVDGLEPLATDPDGEVGEVLFPVAEGAPGRLTEVKAQFPGETADLNLDGDTDDADVTAEALLLPVLLRVRWSGPGGEEQTYELRTVLSDI